jgi:outer membrane immunogenic protein
MKKFLVSLCFSTALLGSVSTAFAADLDPGAPPPPTDDLRQASYDWSGMYAGASLGVSCANGILTETAPAVLPALPIVTTHAAEECAKNIGLHAGYNHQFNQFVIGVESGIGYNHGWLGEDATIRSGTNMMVDIRARAGYAIDNTLLYAALGYAGGRNLLEENVLTPPAIVGEWTNGQKAWHHGYVMGAGIEHALTDVIRIRAEYNYMRLGAVDSYTTNCGCTTEVNYGGMHTFKVGMSYAF